MKILKDKQYTDELGREVKTWRDEVLRSELSIQFYFSDISVVWSEGQHPGSAPEKNDQIKCQQKFHFSGQRDLEKKSLKTAKGNEEVSLLYSIFTFLLSACTLSQTFPISFSPQNRTFYFKEMEYRREN